MKCLIGIILFLGFRLSLSLPTDDAVFQNSRLSHLTKLPFVKSASSSGHDPDTLPSVSGSATNLLQQRKLSLSKKPYLFISDSAGSVIIIDAISYDEIISYVLPELTRSVSAIVGDTFYNIVTQNGTIFSTSLESIVESPSYINWNLVGSFPSESSDWMRNGVAVDGTLIYFVTNLGRFYVYDTILRTVTKLGNVVSGDVYASLVVASKILYIHKYSNLYSFDGTTLNKVTTPEVRYHSGIFRMGNNVCRIGGNTTNIFPDPVMCYNPKDQKWTSTNYVNEARWYPGVAAMESKTYVFGGFAHFSPNTSDFWRSSIEVLNHETNTWSYIPSRLSLGQAYIQALSFYF